MNNAPFAPKPTVANYTLAPSGTFVARCCQVIYLGQHEETYQGQPKGLVSKLRIAFELPTELHEFQPGKPEPFMIGREYSYSLGERATLRQHAESWRGGVYTTEELGLFDPMKMLGRPALITITHKAKPDGRKVAKLDNVTGMPKGMTCPNAILEPISYSVLWKREHPTFAKLPQWIQEKCSQCDEWRTAPTPAQQAADDAGAETPLVDPNTSATNTHPF
jgi:hypothetical protein